MASHLSDRQQHDLFVTFNGLLAMVLLKSVYRHKAMLDYLYNAGYKKSFEQLREEAPDMVSSEVKSHL